MTSASSAERTCARLLTVGAVMAAAAVGVPGAAQATRNLAKAKITRRQNGGYTARQQIMCG